MTILTFLQGSEAQASDKIVTAIISLTTALITAIISALIAWRQIKINRERWREEVALDQKKWKRDLELEQDKWKRQIEHEQEENRKEIEREQERWKQEIERERSKWLAEQKASYDLELYKVRLETYPEILKVIGDLSTRASEQLTPEKAKQVANKINQWIYSAGGLYASKEARGALLGVREVLLSWDKQKDWGHLYALRNPAILLLRRDIDVKGLESYDLNNPQSLLDGLKEAINSIK